MWGSASVCVPSALLRIKVCGLYFDYATLRSVTVRGWGSGYLRSLSEVEVSVFFRVFRG